MQPRMLKVGGVAALVTIALTLGSVPERLSAQAQTSVTVTLGSHGGEITLVRQEGQTVWMRSGSTETFTSGTEVTVEYMGVTNTYVVTLDTATSTWSAEYEPVRVTVGLGGSDETLEVTRNENTTWQIDSDTPLNSGDTHTIEGGNTYELTFSDGEWSARYVPAAMMIGGTALTAVAKEDGTGYTIMDLVDQTLDQDGMGDVRSDLGNFRVHMDADGNLIGVQYEEPLDGQNTTTGTNFGDGSVTVSVDDPNTDPNEAGTMIIIDDVEHLTRDLLKPAELDRIVAEVRDEVEGLVSEIKGLIAVNDSEADDARTDHSDQFDTKWHAIDVLLDKIFGADRTNAADEDEIDNLETRPSDAATMVEQLDAILAALSTADALKTATADDGVFDGKMITVGNLYGTGVSTVGGKNIVAGVLDEIETLVGQIKAFVAVNDSEADDAKTDFSGQFDTRWHAIDVLLDRVFGADRTDVADEDEIDNLETRPSDAAEMVEQLDAILAALGDADASRLRWRMTESSRTRSPMTTRSAPRSMPSIRPRLPTSEGPRTLASVSSRGKRGARPRTSSERLPTGCSPTVRWSAHCTRTCRPPAQRTTRAGLWPSTAVAKPCIPVTSRSRSGSAPGASAAWSRTCSMRTGIPSGTVRARSLASSWRTRPFRRTAPLTSMERRDRRSCSRPFPAVQGPKPSNASWMIRVSLPSRLTRMRRMSAAISRAGSLATARR